MVQLKNNKVMKNESSNLVPGLLFGAAIGALSTYLIIKNKGSIKRELENAGEKVRHSMHEFAEKARNRAEEFTAKAKEKIDDLKDEVKSKAS